MPGAAGSCEPAILFEHPSRRLVRGVMEPAQTQSDRTDRQASPPAARQADRSLIRWIMLGVLAWGCVQALGAWTLNHDWRRPLVVMACVAGFLGFWLLLLRARGRRAATDCGKRPMVRPSPLR